MWDKFVTLNARLAKSGVWVHKLVILRDFERYFRITCGTLQASSWTLQGHHFGANFFTKGAKLTMPWKLCHWSDFCRIVLISNPSFFCAHKFWSLIAGKYNLTPFSTFAAIFYVFNLIDKLVKLKFFRWTQLVVQTSSDCECWRRP